MVAAGFMKLLFLFNLHTETDTIFFLNQQEAYITSRWEMKFVFTHLFVIAVWLKSMM